MNDNMKLYNAFRSVPKDALKPITAGRLKGMSDINPVWRIKALTEMFGPCGVGWWYDIIEKRVIDDEITHQRIATVDIKLYYVDPETGAISQGIPGTGGSSLVAQERNGPYLSDEAFKMALTDAISVSCKALGIAADVYFANDRTKYTSNKEEKPNDEQPKETPQNAPEMATKAQIEFISNKLSPEDLAAMKSKYGEHLERLSKETAGKALTKIKDMGKAEK